MSHLILENDLTFSTGGKEWHGLAVEATPEEMPGLIRANLDLKIRELSLFGKAENGEEIAFPDHKVLAIDASAIQPHPGREKHPAALTPIHCPKQGYQPLENLQFFEIAEKAFSDLGIPMPVETAGTLGNMARFYFSVDASALGAIKTPDGQAIRAFLSFLTSHDGFIAPSIFDSYIRVVCANTFGFVMRELHNFALVGKHTSGGLASLDNLGKALENWMAGKAEVEKAMERLANVALSRDAMREVAAGYFFSDAIASGSRIPDNVTMTTQSFNATEEITQLARTGSGNRGESAFDLWNGATDYWSNGNGAGSIRVGLAKRVARAQFGGAADHKAAFSRYIFNPEAVEVCRKIGARALQNYAIAKN